MLVDSHCHLNFPEFKEDLPEVLDRAKVMGVTTFLTVNTRLEEALDLQEIADRYDRVFCSVGVHPHDAGKYDQSSLKEQIKTKLNHSKVVALGETGLDYYYNNSPRQEQISSFKTHLDLGCELDLPVIVHTRDADADTIACMDEFPDSKGVFHCFTGALEMAKKGLARGFNISFSGIITFKKSEELREVVRYVPLEKMLVETDAPFLAPVPHRGKRNEPAFTRHTAELIAEIKQVSLEEVARITTDNFYQLFTRADRG